MKFFSCFSLSEKYKYKSFFLKKILFLPFSKQILISLYLISNFSILFSKDDIIVWTLLTYVAPLYWNSLSIILLSISPLNNLKFSVSSTDKKLF